MPSTAEKLKSDPEHRSIVEGALKESLGDTSYHENFVEGVKSVTDSKEAVLEAERKATQVREHLEKEYQKNTLVDDTKALQRAFKEAHLTEDDFKNIPEWNSLTREQKMLVVQQASQEILTNVKKIGEERFEQKNRINFSINPIKWNASILEKVTRRFGKSAFISTEEKAVLKEIENGKIKPKEQTLKRLAQKTKDMELAVKEKEGKLFIEFAKAGASTTEQERKIIDQFNAIASEFSRMPDAWKNEQAARSTDKGFKKENYKKYELLQKQYADARDALIKIKQIEYEKQSPSKRDALKQALIETTQTDYKIAMLQFENTNPDAIAELDRIKNESSWGRLLNNENAWKGIYMGSGFLARSVATGFFGAATGPFVSTIVGGWRARRKASQEINKAIAEGRTTATLQERKKEGKAGSFDTKNNNAATLLNGAKANSKEVATFVDADSQIQRLDNLIKKIETTSEKDRQELLQKLEERLHYIEQKGDQGLINFGSENPGALNYKLLEYMSKAVMYVPTSLNIAPSNETPVERTARESLKAKMAHREELLQKIMEGNTERVKKEQSSFKTSEMVRGAMIGAGFSVLGWKVRDWFSGTPDGIQGNATTNEAIEKGETQNAPAPTTQERTTPPWGVDKAEGVAKGFEQIKNAGEIHKPIEVQLSSKGSIQTFLDLKEKLRLEYGKDLAHAPASVQHIMNTNATKLAEEFNMYNPTDADESMMAPAGSKFIIDEQGNFSYQELGAKDASVLEEATQGKATGEYKGKMFDYDKAKTLKVETAQNVGTSTPETPQTNTANIPSQTVETGAPAQGLHQNIDEIFPSDQEIQGTPRDAFRALVNNHYESTQGETWKNLPQADKNAEVWMYEKFGKVTVGQTPDGRMSISNPIDPAQNLGIDLKSVPVAEAIKTNTTVASGIADLQKIARAQLGYDMVIDKNESTSSYIHRVFTALESASQEQPEAPALEEEINRMGRPGKILPGDYMADQSQEEYMGETSVNQTEVSASNSSEVNPAGEDGGLGRAEKGPGTGKVYTETLEETKNPIKWEKYRDHKIITADDVKGRNEVIGISPNTNDRGITYRDWNRVFDNKIVDPEADNVKFGSYNQYETERELQLLFGKGEKIGNTINMSYFREQPEWKTVSKVPARYFFNELFGNEYVSHYPREISDEQLNILKKAGLVRDVNVVDPTTGAVTRSMQFTHHDELARLAQAYRHINPNEAQPYPNETIEDYVSRLMKKVHQTQDGSFFARKHDINFDEAGQSIQQQGPTQQMPVYTPDNPGIISPTRGIYNTGGSSPSYGPSNYGPSYYGPQGNYNPQYGPQGFNTGSTRGDVIVGGVGVAQVALNEGVNAINGNTQTGGGKRILNSAVQTGVQIGVNGIMRQIFGNGGGYYGGGSNWQ